MHRNRVEPRESDASTVPAFLPLQRDDVHMRSVLTGGSCCYSNSNCVAVRRWVYFSYRLLRRFTKGFLFGYTGKFAFAFIGLCLRHKLNLTRLLPDLAALFFKRELWSYGAFLGSFLTLFESSIRLLKMKSWLSRQMLTRHHRSVRVIVSASVAAGVAIRFLPADTRLGISMFFCVRALEILVRYLVEREEKPYAQHGAPAAGARAAQAAADAQPSVDATAFKPGVDAAAAAPVNSAAATIATVPSATKAVLLLDPSVDTQSELILPAPSALERARRSLKRAVVKLAALPASEHFDTLVRIENCTYARFSLFCWPARRGVLSGRCC